MPDEEYDVGYKRPPKHTQFKKGESGNPSGRPKGTKNLKTDLREELSEQILVREGERAIKISKQRAIVKSLIAKTVKGDMRAATTVFNLMVRLLDVETSADEDAQPLSREEREILDALEQKLLRSATQKVQEATASGRTEEEK